MHKCPKNGCQIMVPQSLLCCGPHWRVIPYKIRQRVNTTWKNWTSGKGDAREYLEARNAALAALNGGPEHEARTAHG